MYDSRELTRVRVSLLLVAAIGWACLLLQPGTPMHARTVTSLAASWAIMLIAMMSPALIWPVHHLRRRSFKHRRTRAVALFAAGYAAIWIALGAGLVAIELAVMWLAPHSYRPAVVALLVALVWQCSPIKQRCLNRCHAHPELAVFGAAADFQALRFGMTHALWCAGSCWALMLFAMLLPEGHLVAMAAATVLILGERLERPRAARWGVHGLGKTIRIVVAQAKIRVPPAVSPFRAQSQT